MTGWYALLLGGWTAILHLFTSGAIKAEIKKFGPTLAKKLYEDRVMRARAQTAIQKADAAVKAGAKGE